jgi:TPR repeat protein
MQNRIIIAALVVFAANFETCIWAQKKILVNVPNQFKIKKITEENKEEYKEEEIELEQEESILADGTTFEELIQQKRWQGLPFIMARVCAQGSCVNYYAAHPLNKWLQTPKEVAGPSLDPLTNAKITGVQYFIISGIDDRFEYLCSASVILRDPHDNIYKQIFDGNDTQEPKKRALSQVLVGDLYRNANGIEKKHAIACRYYDFVVKEKADRELLAKAQLELGRIYLDGGYGVEKNYSTAFHCFLPVTNQSINPELSADAACGIGEIYFEGDATIRKNYENAVKWFKQAASQKDSPVVAANAQLRLGQIYFAGDALVPKNCATAVYWLERAAKQNHARDVSIVAMLGLGTIYASGGSGIPQNTATARHWFSLAAGQESDGLPEKVKNTIIRSKKRAQEKLAELERKHK